MQHNAVAQYNTRGAGKSNCSWRSKQWTKQLSRGSHWPWHDQSLSITPVSQTNRSQHHQKIEVNQEKMIRKLVDVVTFTLYPQPSTTHTHIHWNSEQPKIWSNSNKKMCATNLVLDSLHFFGFPPSVYFCLLQSTLNLFHLKYVSFFNSPSLIREAIPREKCSFF